MQTSALPTNLPSQLLQVLNELDVAPQGPGQAVGGDFWLRLAAQLEELEEVAAVLPEDVTVDELASWLAAGLGGEALPEDGKELPLPAGLLLDPVQAKAALDHARPLPVAVHTAVAGHQPTADGSDAAGLVDADLSFLRSRLAEVLAELRPMPGMPTAEARRIPAAPLPMVFTALPTAEMGPLPQQGAPAGTASSEARISDFLLAGGLPAAGSADAGPGRSLPEVAALGARFAEASALGARLAEASAQSASLAGTAAVDSTTGSQSTTGLQPGSANSQVHRFFNLDIPLQQPGWDRAFGNGVRWMVDQNVHVAEMRLSPPNLGPIEVRLQVEGDRTHVNIVAPHAATREAVEAALPRLREMFAESGLNLGDVNVRQDSAGRGGSDAGGQPGQAASAMGGSPVEQDAAAFRGGPATGQGLVDFYA